MAGGALPQAIYRKVGVYNGQQVDVRMVADAYRSSASGNVSAAMDYGCIGEYGSISLASGWKARLSLHLQDSDGNPLLLPYFYFSFFDTDTIYEALTVMGHASHALDDETELSVSTGAGGTGGAEVFSSSGVHGIKSPLDSKKLSPAQKRHAVALLFANTSSFEVILGNDQLPDSLSSSGSVNASRVYQFQGSSELDYQLCESPLQPPAPPSPPQPSSPAMSHCEKIRLAGLEDPSCSFDPPLQCRLDFVSMSFADASDPDRFHFVPDGSLMTEFTIMERFNDAISRTRSNEPFWCQLERKNFSILDLQPTNAPYSQYAHDRLDPESPPWTLPALFYSQFPDLPHSRFWECLDIASPTTLNGMQSTSHYENVGPGQGSQPSQGNWHFNGDYSANNQFHEVPFGGAKRCNMGQDVQQGSTNGSRVGDGVVNSLDLAVLMCAQFAEAPYENVWDSLSE